MRKGLKIFTAVFSKYTALLAMVLLLANCAKKCQPLPESQFTSIVGQEWRMVTTTNPRMVKDVTRYSFLIMVFQSAFEGAVYRVINNQRYETPALTFKYNIESQGKRGMARIVYSTVPVQPEGENAQPQQPTTSAPTDYSYSLSYGLTMVESQTGFQYDYVPFTGNISPDAVCQF